MNTLALLSTMAPTALPEFNAGTELLRVVLSLLGIIALIVVAGWFTRRMQRGAGAAGRRIRCVETFSVGPRERLVLLDADGKRLLVGMGPGGMCTLHVYDGSVPQTDGSAAPAASTSPIFGDVLARWKQRS